MRGTGGGGPGGGGEVGELDGDGDGNLKFLFIVPFRCLPACDFRNSAWPGSSSSSSDSSRIAAKFPCPTVSGLRARGVGDCTGDAGLTKFAASWLVLVGRAWGGIDARFAGVLPEFARVGERTSETCDIDCGRVNGADDMGALASAPR